MHLAWEFAAATWQRFEAAVAADGDVRTAVVVASAATVDAFLCFCLGLSRGSGQLFRTTPGSVSIVEFRRDGAPLSPQTGIVRCVNYTAHLGRWSVPVTRDDLDSLEGIDAGY